MGVFSPEMTENCSWWQLLPSTHRNSHLGQDFPEGPAALALPRAVLLESCPRVPAAGSPRWGSVRERVSLRDRLRWPTPRHARCPLGMLALHPRAAQPGDASRSCSSGRKYSYGRFRGKIAQMLPTDTYKLFSFYR